VVPLTVDPPIFSDEWRRVTAGYPRFHTVYWVRHLWDGRRIGVERDYNDQHEPTDSWRWTLYAGEPYITTHGPDTVLATGWAPNVPVGQKMAEKAAKENQS
jgi:hypothetical protein